jgi:hypothetical protein
MSNWLSGIEVRYPSSVDCYEFAQELKQWIVDHYPNCDFEISLFTNSCLVRFADLESAFHFKLAWGGR